MNNERKSEWSRAELRGWEGREEEPEERKRRKRGRGAHVWGQGRGKGDKGEWSSRGRRGGGGGRKWRKRGSKTSTPTHVDQHVLLVDTWSLTPILLPPRLWGPPPPRSRACHLVPSLPDTLSITIIWTHSPSLLSPPSHPPSPPSISLSHPIVRNSACRPLFIAEGWVGGPS